MNKMNVVSISRLRTYTDGDGVSTLVGSMGCPLRCGYCLNPNTWDGSSKSKSMTVDELYERVKRDNIYFLATSGGIVFGGGEPLLYSGFISEFINKYRFTKWKFYLESSLSVELDSLRDVIDLIDCFYIDCKDMDRKRYELYTKGDYDLFIKNLMFLRDNISEEKIKIRLPKISGFHKSNEVELSYKKLKDMGFKHIEIFDYIEDVEKIKEISEIALENKKEFLERVME